MPTTYKAIASLRELVDLLKKSCTTLPVITESFDSNEDPVVTLSADATPAAGEKVVVLRMKAIGAIGARDIFGNVAQQFSHHVIQICTEANPAAGAGADILTPAEILPIVVECGRKGSFVEWYTTAATVIPSTAAMVAGNLRSTWRDLYWNVSKAG